MTPKYDFFGNELKIGDVVRMTHPFVHDIHEFGIGIVMKLNVRNLVIEYSSVTRTIGLVVKYSDIIKFCELADLEKK